MKRKKTAAKKRENAVIAAVSVLLFLKKKRSFSSPKSKIKNRSIRILCIVSSVIIVNSNLKFN